MGLFEKLGGAPTRQPNAQEALQQIKAHPGDVLHQAGYSVPEGMTDGRQIVQHLIQSGQVGNSRVQQLMRMLGGR